MSESFSSLTILCISPLSIPNPNFGQLKDLSGKKRVAGDLMLLKDCSSAYIRVPCGHCPECIASKQMQLVQRVQMESLKNYIFFATLTYNQDSLPHVCTSTGYDIPFADIRDLQNAFKRLRKSNAFTRSFRYFAVSELGTKRGRPHFHCLFFIPKLKDDDPQVTPYQLEGIINPALLFEWRRNYGSTRSPIYKPLCTYQEKWRNGKKYSNYDCHYVRPLDDDSESNVAFYVLKYMLKRSDRETKLQQALKLNLSEDEYNDTYSLVRSRYIVSKGFGLNGSKSPFGDWYYDEDIVKYLKFCISKSQDFPKFFNPVTGKSFPLARYYKNTSSIFGIDEATRFYFESDLKTLDTIPEFDDKSHEQLLKSVSDYEKKIKQVSDRGDFDNYTGQFD